MMGKEVFWTFQLTRRPMCDNVNKMDFRAFQENLRERRNSMTSMAKTHKTTISISNSIFNLCIIFRSL